MKKPDKSRPGLATGGLFQRFARSSARAAGHSRAFGLALGLIAAWGITGPLFQFSDTWQLVINTATTIVTFLMVFLIQNTQNRDSEAVQLKLDELIRAHQETHNALLDIEELSVEELDQIKTAYGRLAREARESLRSGQSDLGLTDVGPGALFGNTPPKNGSGPRDRNRVLRRPGPKHKDKQPVQPTAEH